MSWWGSYELTEGQAAHLEIGPLDLWIERRGKEWRVAHESANDPLSNRLERRVPCTGVDLLSQTAVRRIAISSGHSTFSLRIRQADRPVVSRPEKPFVIPPGEGTYVFVSTPLWCEISVGTEPRRVLQELPIYRPSDTWFGPPNQDGELCYASRTFWRTEPKEIRFLPHRAITRVQIRNNAAEELRVDRLNIPVPRLPVYCTREEQLWTDDVNFDRTEGDDFATLRLSRPEHRSFGLDGSTKLADARMDTSANLVVRAFSSLFD